MTNNKIFEELGLSEELLNYIQQKGFTKPTEVQQLAIPKLIANDKDLIVQAQTGTGKTAAFALPIVQLIDQSNSDVRFSLC